MLFEDAPPELEGALDSFSEGALDRSSSSPNLTPKPDPRGVVPPARILWRGTISIVYLYLSLSLYLYISLYISVYISISLSLSLSPREGMRETSWLGSMAAVLAWGGRALRVPPPSRPPFVQGPLGLLARLMSLRSEGCSSRFRGTCQD